MVGGMWDWAAWQGIGTVVSAAVAIWALLAARGSGRAAKEATSAANRTATALERLVVATEAGAIAQAREAPTRGAAWRIEWLSGEAYLLHNDGGGTAANTIVEVDQTQHLVLRNAKVGDVGPGDARRFLAIQTMATRDTTVTIRWTDENGQEHTWDRPLPPKR